MNKQNKVSDGRKKIEKKYVNIEFRMRNIDGPEKIDPHCDKSPTKNHEFEMSLSQALVVGLTCYNCIHCGQHKDVYHYMPKPLYSLEELEEMSRL